MNKRNFIIMIVLIFLAVFSAVWLLLSSLSSSEPPKEEEEHIYIGPYDFILLNRDGLYSYEDDNYYSMAGIDISEHNGTVDFAKVKESGIGFVYLRLGWRGYTEGILHEDASFRRYYQAAKDNGLQIGVYFFSQALNEEEAVEEAEMLKKILKTYPIDLPVVYDYEYIDHDEARTDALDRDQCTANALAFFKALEGSHDVMLYVNSVLISDHYDMEKLEAYKLWYAQYNALPECEREFAVWQYSDKGKIDGCEKDVDLNIMFIKK